MTRLRLGLSTYSFWHFKPEKVPIEYCLEKAYEMGFGGVEILHRQMASEENDYLQKLKRTAVLRGLDVICLSIHQTFVSPDKEERERNIAHTLHGLELAYRLGAPAIRINSGRWGTLKSWEEMVARDGIEPPLPGYTDDDAWGWVIDCLQRCLPKAQECGVIMALENHWGLTATPEGVLRIVEGVNSPWVKVMMDCGNFPKDTYAGLAKIAPHAAMVHAKTYFGGGEWYSLDLNYARIAKILRDAGFTGYVSLEFEGKEDPLTGIPKSVELIRKGFAAG